VDRVEGGGRVAVRLGHHQFDDRTGVSAVHRGKPGSPSPILVSSILRMNIPLPLRTAAFGLEFRGSLWVGAIAGHGAAVSAGRRRAFTLRKEGGGTVAVDPVSCASD
jgi:hypothetical protein